MKIGRKIHEWYKKNKRDLPMRRTKDPYRIWIAEVIFQQTRINQGLSYYLEFIEAFPDIHSLASAREEEVLKKWQGLGYYNRARNLHGAAKYVDTVLGGRIPGSYDELLGLKGVGKYTAAAIASFCYGEPVAAVDGNVSRVIARLFGVEEPVSSSRGAGLIQSLAGEMLDRKDPGTHNQAMIEFGALQCVPSSPDCPACPLSGECDAFLNHRVDRLPVKTKKAEPVDRWMYFFIFSCEGETILEKRGDRDIWKSLYHFPVVETPSPRPEEEVMGKMMSLLLSHGNGMDQNEKAPPQTAETDQVMVSHKPSETIRHQLSHLTIHARFIRVELNFLPYSLPLGWIRVPPGQMDHYPVPRLMERYMESAKF